MRILFFFFGLLFIFSAKAQQTTDMPRRGEGITSFLKRNNRPGRTYYKAFLELNKKRLRGKKELQYGVRYVLPPLSEDCGGKGDATSSGSPVLHEPLFGKELAQVKVTSSRLKGACFYVVSLVLGLLLTWAVPALSEDMGVTELSDVHNVICGSVAAVYVAVLYVLLRRWERESGLSYS